MSSPASSPYSSGTDECVIPIEESQGLEPDTPPSQEGKLQGRSVSPLAFKEGTEAQLPQTTADLVCDFCNNYTVTVGSCFAATSLTIGAIVGWTLEEDGVIPFTLLTLGFWVCTAASCGVTAALRRNKRINRC